jgi:Flp pilus assembly protein TadD
LPEYVEDAELCLQRLQLHLPDNVEILRALAATAAVRNDVDEAHRRYSLLLEKAPADTEAQQYLKQHPEP